MIHRQEKLPEHRGARQSDGSARAVITVALAVLALAGSACGSAPVPTPPPEGPVSAAPDSVEPDTMAPGLPPATDAATPVSLGVDVLLRDSLHLLAGRRVGLITNHTGLSWPDGEPVSTIDRLAGAPGVDLVALFSPEHGIRGRAEAGEKVASDVDPATGLPIHSLYGSDRKPTAAMLQDVDVLVFDIQDIGTRYYTYVWTMALAMEAAGETGLPFVVLDRPNPIGGRLLQGNVLDPEHATFVGLYPVPMRHGLTAGELARVLAGEFGVEVDLRVVPMNGWVRDEWYDATRLPFVPPSPNMPSLASATHYPGTCLFEGTNLSVGRGTAAAFQQIGAPWLDAELLAERLNRKVRTPGPAEALSPGAPAEAGPGLRGVRFEPVTFVPDGPGDGKFGGETVRGLRFVVTDRRVYDPTVAAIAALVEIRRAHTDRLEWYVAHFDRLAGTERVREGVMAGLSAAAITATWPAESGAFEELRQPYLLYP